MSANYVTVIWTLYKNQARLIVKKIVENSGNLAGRQAVATWAREKP